MPMHFMCVVSANYVLFPMTTQVVTVSKERVVLHYLDSKLYFLSNDYLRRTKVRSSFATLGVSMHCTNVFYTFKTETNPSLYWHFQLYSRWKLDPVIVKWLVTFSAACSNKSTLNITRSVQPRYFVEQTTYILISE